MCFFYLFAHGLPARRFLHVGERIRLDLFRRIEVGHRRDKSCKVRDAAALIANAPFIDAAQRFRVLVIDAVIDLYCGRRQLNVLHRHVKGLDDVVSSVAAQQFFLQRVTHGKLEGDSITALAAHCGQQVFSMVHLAHPFHIFFHCT